MNKLRLLFVLLMAFSASAILAQFPYKLNDYQEKNKVHTHYVDNTFQEHLNNLKGNVKSINQIDYTCVQMDSLNFRKEGIRESNNSVAYFFDKKKRITESWIISTTGVATTKKYYRDFANEEVDSIATYGNTGRLISVQAFVYDTNQLPSLRKVSMMGQTRENSYPVRHNGEFTELEVSDIVLTYNKKHQLVSDYSKKRDIKYGFEYHENGNLKTRKLWQEGDLLSVDSFDLRERQILRYGWEHENAFIIKPFRDSSTYFDDNSQASYTTIRSTNDDRNPFEIKNYEYEYKDGNLWQIVQIMNGLRYSSSEFKRNKYGDPVVSYTKTGEAKYIYLTYDEKGNWTTKVIIAEGEAKSLIEREITYYK